MNSLVFMIQVTSTIVGLLILSILLPKTKSQLLISKPGCASQCGNVTIPYPFGMDNIDCCLNDDFFITCNNSYDPPQPFLRNSTKMVTNISLDGDIRILNSVASDCYDGRYDVAGHELETWKLELKRFSISSSRNKFTVIGCDSYAYLQGYRNEKRYSSGCMSLCASRDLVDTTSCSGSGCCQIEIPSGLNGIEVSPYSFNNHDNVSDFSPCTYSFVVEQGAFNFSSRYLSNISELEVFPIILEWSIEEGIAITSHNGSVSYLINDTLCEDHANSYIPDNFFGYRCICNDGFEGNPYIGCEDIDECKDESLNDCIDKCINLVGSYKCSCPRGYVGDGRRNGSRCMPPRLFLLSTILSSGITLMSLLIMGSWIYLILKKRKFVKLKERFFMQHGGLILEQKLSKIDGSREMARIFSIEELKKATNNLDASTIIGKGGYGVVHKGVLVDDTRSVAIKKSTIVDKTQMEQFINEVVVLSQVNHRNIVRLLGCCLETEVPLLVYEFVNNGTLFEHIHDETKSSILSWGARLRIAVETAGALSYLHSSASVPIIHRDVKSTNILLESNYTAKVSDFGASRLVPLDEAQLSTMVQGTLGYLDPEYLHTSQLTEKSDVYSFGVVLAELLTGREALSFNKPEEERSLAKYFLSSIKEGRLHQILDERVAKQAIKEHSEDVATLAKKCLALRGEERPTMKEVEMELERLLFVVERHPWRSRVKTEETEQLLPVQEIRRAYYGSLNKHVALSIDYDR